MVYSINNYKEEMLVEWGNTFIREGLGRRKVKKSGPFVSVKGFKKISHEYPIAYIRVRSSPVKSSERITSRV